MCARKLRHILLICLAAYTLPSLGGAFPSDKASPDTNPSQETATAAMDLLEDAEADDGGLPDKTGAETNPLQKAIAAADSAVEESKQLAAGQAKEIELLRMALVNARKQANEAALVVKGATADLKRALSPWHAGARPSAEVLPTAIPTKPTLSRSSVPTEQPTHEPSTTPTEAPTTLPPTTDDPSFAPTRTPSEQPTSAPSAAPTEQPTAVPTSAPRPKSSSVSILWTLSLSKGSYGNKDIGASAFNKAFAASPHHIVKRVCATCSADYKEVYYRRYTSPKSFGVYDYLKQNWFSRNNVINRDFGIFSSYSDALAKRNPWQYCNYDDRGVGFPRDCGKHRGVGGQWNSWTRGGKDVAFSIETGGATAASVAASKPATTAGACMSGWMKVNHLCFSPSTTGKTGCTSTDCDGVGKVCTDQGARLPSKDELHTWLDNGGKRTSTYGVTGTRNGAKHWLLSNNGDYGWHAWTCCDHPNRYYVCVKDTSSGASLTATPRSSHAPTVHPTRTPSKNAPVKALPKPVISPPTRPEQATTPARSASDYDACQAPKGAQLAEHVECANKKLFACLKSAEKKTETCQCYAGYMTWWKQNLQADESDGKGFWVSCPAGIIGGRDCDRSKPCPTGAGAPRDGHLCAQHKPRLAYTSESAKKAGAAYRAALEQVHKNIKHLPAPATRPRPKTNSTKFARLPVGQCFGALREEIHTAADCQKAAIYLGIQGTVKQIKTEDESPKPSRCYFDLSSRNVVFNARDSAHDAEEGKYEKICDTFVEAAETGSRYDPSGTIMMPNGELSLFAADVQALGIKLHESYWFISRDGSRQRGPYQFTYRDRPNTYVGDMVVGWPWKFEIAQEGSLRKGLYQGFTGAENPYNLCMEVLPHLKLQMHGIPNIGWPYAKFAKTDHRYPGRDPRAADVTDWTGQHWCAKPGVSLECRKKWPEGCPEAKYYCDNAKKPNMAAGAFLVKEPVRHAKACKRPKEWLQWQGTENTTKKMITMKADLDDDNITDYAWCSSEDGTRCSGKLRGTTQSTNGCSREENTPWIVTNAPQLFVKPDECTCSCDKPRCFGGKTNALLQAISYKDGTTQNCEMSLPGRKAMQRCCDYKIEKYKRVITEKCGVSSTDIDSWCDRVPDGMEIQLGGRPEGTPPGYFNHQSTNACAESKWRSATLWTKEMDKQARKQASACVDNDEDVKKVSGGQASSCRAVASLCHDTKIGALVRAYCRKTCDTCTSSIQEVAVELDDAVSGKQGAVISWAGKTSAPVDRASGWLTPTPTSPPVLKKTQAGYNNQCME